MSYRCSSFYARASPKPENYFKGSSRVKRLRKAVRMLTGDVTHSMVATVNNSKYCIVT